MYPSDPRFVQLARFVMRKSELREFLGIQDTRLREILNAGGTVGKSKQLAPFKALLEQIARHRRDGLSSTEVEDISWMDPYMTMIREQLNTNEVDARPSPGRRRPTPDSSEASPAAHPTLASAVRAVVKASRAARQADRTISSGAHTTEYGLVFGSIGHAASLGRARLAETRLHQLLDGLPEVILRELVCLTYLGEKLRPTDEIRRHVNREMPDRFLLIQELRSKDLGKFLNRGWERSLAPAHRRPR